MSKRWDYDDEEENIFGDMQNEEEDDDGEEYISEEEYQELIGRASELQEVQLELAEMDINHRLLTETIALMKSSWGWSFKSTKTKLKEIGMAYKFFHKITDTRDKS